MRFPALVLAIALGANAASAQNTIIPANADLFSAGQSVASTRRGGALPVVIALPAGTNRVVEFSSVTGLVDTDGPSSSIWASNGPDGGDRNVFGSRWTDIASADGISGLRHPHFMFLAGVFLTSAAPVAGTEPSRLDFFTLGSDFADLAPLPQQSFFIGDGRTATGQVQRFHVPDSATRLYLGIEDAWDFGSVGASPTPGYYSDNTGSFTATYTVAVPLPGAAAAGAPVLAGLAALSLRRKHLRAR